MTSSFQSKNCFRGHDDRKFDYPDRASMKTSLPFAFIRVNRYNIDISVVFVGIVTAYDTIIYRISPRYHNTSLCEYGVYVRYRLYRTLKCTRSSDFVGKRA